MLSISRQLMEKTISKDCSYHFKTNIFVVFGMADSAGTNFVTRDGSIPF